MGVADARTFAREDRAIAQDHHAVGGRHGRLSGQVAIVTGGGRGIGAAVCRLFAAEGAKVAIADVRADDARRLADEIGAAAEAHQHDVTSESSWTSLTEAVERRLGPVDVLVNNAGVLLFRTLLDTTPEEFDRVLNVNLKGAFLGIRTVGPLMAGRKSGSIVNLSSIEGARGANGAGAYACSKWAVRGLTRVAALELGHLGVRVNAVLPGGVNTPMANPGGADPSVMAPMFAQVPAQRIAKPLELAHAILFLASPEASYLMGSELVVDGGMTAGSYYMGMPGAPSGVPS